ncbi:MULTISPECIES: hypothetical protein [unclassified Streptomyces]|uniref:hypothetical protein n=1 Tax=unclassified Streptomyces TaxID=2593676 RepID=UPI002E81D095|nr:hypothetical protein [Streptomyces sp. NBC_00589]WTI37103.1 hypothetical protein OIC96_19840 [Streptomyces sp. NBC_00775]WUB29221.1 hypothetical protein OHA51_29895 [Streptomyces sp. NBC_00589]
MNPIPTLTYGISCPPDWIPLPVGPNDDIMSWAEQTAQGIVGRSLAAGYDIDPETVRTDLRARTEDSRGRDPFYAFAFYPDGFDAALGLLEVDLIHPDESVPRMTLDWLTETFSTDDFGPPHVTRTEEPIGPAVRIRQNFAADGAPPGGPGILLETLTYGLLPTGTESLVVLLMSWTVPGIAEAMEEAADAVVKTLTVES